MSFASIDMERVRPGEKTRRGVFVPPWYAPHQNLDVEVKQDGVSLGFTLREVAPERRWAVGHDGEIVDQDTFEQKLQEVYEGQFLWNNPPVQIDADMAKTLGYPSVDTYVAKGIDPNNPNRLTPLVDKRKLAPVDWSDTTPVVDAKEAARLGFRPVAKSEPQVADELGSHMRVLAKMREAGIIKTDEELARAFDAVMGKASIPLLQGQPEETVPLPEQPDPEPEEAGPVLVTRAERIAQLREEGKKWAEIGEIMGVSPARCQQIHAKAKGQ